MRGSTSFWDFESIESSKWSLQWVWTILSSLQDFLNWVFRCHCIGGSVPIWCMGWKKYLFLLKHQFICSFVVASFSLQLKGTPLNHVFPAISFFFFLGLWQVCFFSAKGCTLGPVFSTFLFLVFLFLQLLWLFCCCFFVNCCWEEKNSENCAAIGKCINRPSAKLSKVDFIEFQNWIIEQNICLFCFPKFSHPIQTCSRFSEASTLQRSEQNFVLFYLLTSAVQLSRSAWP